MTFFAIYDQELKMDIGVLFYFEKEHSFVIELVEDLDEWTAPLLLTAFVKKGEYSISRDVSFMWVKERIIPGNRQNIGQILTNHNLEAYDEMTFLKLSQGRCCQDALEIRPMETLPDYVEKRMEHNLTECVACRDNALLCFFADDTIRKIKADEIAGFANGQKLLNNRLLFESCRIVAGGRCITFDDAIDLSAELLYRSGTAIPLKPSDFTDFVLCNVMDTTDCCEALSCSRQNLSYLVKHNHLHSLKQDVRGNLFLKGGIAKLTW
ncbi:MAG: hypothetical protein Q4B73_05755 [Lachnospiraceae bacterium]|nr:hypothetical protein [Lachnospiraceae bacterium]